MKKLITICIEKNEKEKRTRIWKICCIISFSTVLLFLAGAAWANLVHFAGPINIDVYSGFQGSGGGAPYTNYVGSLSAPDVMFGTATGFNWHPFGLSSFGADITGILKVDTTNAYIFTLNSDDGSMLYIDGNLIIDNGGYHPPITPKSGTVNLTDGMHPFEVQFFEDYGGESGVDLYVPEPATMALFGLGGLALLRRRRG